MRKLFGYLSILLLGLLVSCAPIATTRTPEPLPEGQTRFGISFGSPLLILLTSVTPYTCEGPDCPFEEAPVPPYFPLSQPLDLRLDHGIGNQTDINVSLQLFWPETRVGGKTLVVDDTTKVAIDYGLSLYLVSAGSIGGVNLPGIALDAGVLWSVPQPDWEVYGSLRGYLVYYVVPAFSTSVGVALPTQDGGSWYLELSLMATQAWRTGQLLWGLTPAIGYRF